VNRRLGEEGINERMRLLGEKITNLSFFCVSFLSQRKEKKK
jgi:hypothetical protein